MRHAARLSLLLLFSLLFAVSLGAQLTVTQEKDAITVASAKASGWKAVIDTARGGVVSALHLPAGGPNLVAARAGLFSLFSMADKPLPDGRTVKSWLYQNARVEKIAVEQGSSRAIAEVRGKTYTLKKEPIIEFHQIYTFLPDRIVCEGKAKWVLGGGTQLADSSRGFTFARDAQVHPVRAASGGAAAVELPITQSGGSFFPAGIDYPMDVEFWFRNGQRIVLRALDVPAPYVKDRRYIYEQCCPEDELRIPCSQLS
jgi:hypothetical protein